MGYTELVSIAERSIGKSGRDLFLSHKTLTIIMAPYENYSIFPQAVDHLYKNIDIPFNLIVVEGNAPEPIRLALEKRQRKHGNMSIIYTNHCPHLANAFNLALMHFKTRFALFTDNGIRFPKGSIENLVNSVKINPTDVVVPESSLIHRKLRTFNGNGKSVCRSIKTVGMRPCFLVSQDLVSGIGKLFGEFSTPYTFGIDLFYRLKSRGVSFIEEKNFKVEASLPPSVRSLDKPLLRLQWSRERLASSIAHLGKSWGIEIEEDQMFLSWLDLKFQEVEKPDFQEVLWHQLVANFRPESLRRIQEAVVHLKPFASFSKNSEFSKLNASIRH